MKEYNWREERKKYQADFRKEEPAAPAAAPAVEPTPAAPAPRKNSLTGIIILAVAVVVAAGILAAVFKPSPQPAPQPIAPTAAGQKPISLPDQPAASSLNPTPVNVLKVEDSASKLAKWADKYKHAVGVVVLSVETQSGNKFLFKCGTAWAFARNKFATNAHVANAIRENLQQIKQNEMAAYLQNLAQSKKFNSVQAMFKALSAEQIAALQAKAAQMVEKTIRNVDAWIMINGGHGESYSISHVQIHRNYGIANSEVNPDVAVLTINGDHEHYFDIADTEKLYSLKPGMPIAYLGFPSENLQKDNVNLETPVASMQSGIMVAVSDFYLKDGGPRNNQYLRHNLPGTGGASGSPIFDAEGEVIGLICAMNIVVTKHPTKTGALVESRAPSAAQINFGVRADLLNGVGKKVALQSFIR